MRPADIEQRLTDAGYTLSLTEKSRYLYHMTQRLIACDGWDALQTPYMTRLWLTAAIRKGRAYTLAELRQIAQPRDNDRGFVQAMEQWVRGAIFKRCVRLTCEHCALEQTTTMQSLTDPLTCAGCQNPILVHLDAQFAYLPNPLFCTGMANGMLTLMRVLRRFAHEMPTGTWVGGVMIEKGGAQTEIDLLFMADDTLHMVEAKDALPESSSIQMQLLRYHNLAQELNASCTLASLPAVPADLAAWCEGWGISVIEG